MNYRIWADILVKHEYFNGKCSDFKFLPEPTSDTTIRHEGILIQEAIGGMRLIAPEEAFSNKIDLIFWAYPTNRSLWNVTDFESILDDQIAFAKINQGSLQWAPCPKESIPEKMRTPKPMFGIEICNHNNADKTQSTLLLKTKKLKWRYCISGLPTDNPVEIVGIKPNKDTPSFETTEIVNNSIVFISTQDIPLRYGAPPLFQLREKKTSKVIIKTLPNMDARSIAEACLDKNRLETVAESFINT